jgi:hypothetical protein
MPPCGGSARDRIEADDPLRIVPSMARSGLIVGRRAQAILSVDWTSLRKKLNEPAEAFSAKEETKSCVELHYLRSLRDS